LEGYEQVDLFEEDEDEEYEEEVVYVTMDLGQLDPNLLPNATSYRLIGLETPTPFLQIGGSIFRGRSETLLGTEIIMQEPPGGGSRNLVPLATTDKRIRFQEVKLIEKGFSGIGAPEDAEDDTNAEQTSKGMRPNETLGGVSREAPSMFSPSVRRKQKGLFQVPKAKRRFHKRPEGYRTSDEE
ncbi:hypothetical protein CPB86DRAFT_664875, partial [Serendipita vermifera]